MNFELTIFSNIKDIDVLNDNVDVEIKLNNGRKFIATFFTIENIKSLLHHYQKTGECANGLYIWATDMIIVDRLTEDVIRKSIVDLINNGEIYHACTEILNP